jgi:hypothetical protein
MQRSDIAAATLPYCGKFTILGITSQQLYVCWISEVIWLESMDRGGQTEWRLSYSKVVQRCCSVPSPGVSYRFIVIDIKHLEYVASILQPMNSCPCVHVRVIIVGGKLSKTIFNGDSSIFILVVCGKFDLW